MKFSLFILPSWPEAEPSHQGRIFHEAVEQIQYAEELGFDAVWLMGVWERSPAAREVALRHAGWQTDFRRALPDLEARDIVGGKAHGGACVEYRKQTLDRERIGSRRDRGRHVPRA